MIENAVAAALGAAGFREDWEPNAYGLELEDLIDWIGREFGPNRRG